MLIVPTAIRPNTRGFGGCPSTHPPSHRHAPCIVDPTCIAPHPCNNIINAQGHSEAAKELSEEAGIQDFVTIELFERWVGVREGAMLKFFFFFTFSAVALS